MILLHQQWGLEVADQFPGVIAFWVSFPLNEVLQLTPPVADSLIVWLINVTGAPGFSLIL